MLKVETEGDNVKVRVVAYPIAAALREVARAVGKEVHIPGNVIGLADRESPDWETGLAAMMNIASRSGLWVREEGGAFAVTVRDPAYMASVGEIADNRSALPPGYGPVAEGIETGYLIWNGHYVKPPYKIETQEAPDRRYVVLLNGAVLFRGGSWQRAPAAQVDLPDGKQFSITEKGALQQYVGQQFASIRARHGKDEAIRALEAFLKTQKILTFFQFDDTGWNLQMRFQDEPEVWHEVYLHTFAFRRDGTARTPEVDARPDMAALQARARAIAENHHQLVEDALKRNGVVVVPSKGPLRAFTGEEAENILKTVSSAMMEIHRQRDLLKEAVWGDFCQEKTDWGLEVILNLRFREMAERWRRENAPRTFD